MEKLSFRDVNTNNPRQPNFIAFAVTAELCGALAELKEHYERLGLHLPISVKGLSDFHQNRLANLFPEWDKVEVVSYHNASTQDGQYFNLQVRYYHPELTQDDTEEKSYEMLREIEEIMTSLSTQTEYLESSVLAFVSPDGLLLPEVIVDNYDRKFAADPITSLSPSAVLGMTKLQVGDLAILEMEIDNYAVVRIAEDGTCKAEATGLEYSDATNVLNDLLVEAPSAGMRM